MASEDWARRALEHFEKEMGLSLMFFIDLSQFDEEVLATSLVDSMNVIADVMEVYEKNSLVDQALQVYRDFFSSATSRDFYAASSNHYLRTAKVMARRMPKPLREFLNNSGLEIARNEATAMCNFLKGDFKRSDAFTGLLQESEEGREVLGKLYQREAKGFDPHQPKEQARRFWMTHQLWRMSVQARCACMGLSEKVERDLRLKEKLPVIEHPIIHEFKIGQNKFYNRLGQEILPSLPTMFEALRCQRKNPSI